MKDIIEFSNGVVSEAAGFNGHTDADWAVLSEAASVTTTWVPDLAKIYGDAIHGTEATKPLVAHLSRADHQQSFAVWFENMISGSPGEVFWAETCLIGLGHAAGGVSNSHVLAMADRIEEEFLKRGVEAFGVERGLQVFIAFKHVFGVAQAVLVDSYIAAFMRGMEDIGMNERLVARIRRVAIRRMMDDARGVLPLIDWTDALSVGLESIDSQHKVLVDLLNALHAGSSQGAGDDPAMKKTLNDLVNYTVEHFAFEERLFDEHQYPSTEEHKAAHVALTTQVGAFNEQFQTGKVKLSGDLFKFLRSWLNGHIRGTDKLYAPYLIERGVK